MPFAASDSIVNINLAERFTREIKVLEVVINYQFQIMMENIHSETYSLQIDNIKNKEEKQKLLNAISNFPCIKKAEWAISWMENANASLAQRIIAFAIVEGIFFSGSFAAIFWLKGQNVMPGLCDSNELIARDEVDDTEFACMIYELCSNKLDESEVHKMFEEAVQIEQEFICQALPCSLLGMNVERMSQYIEYVRDRLLMSLGFSKNMGNKNPLILWKKFQ